MYKLWCYVCAGSGTSRTPRFNARVRDEVTPKLNDSLFAGHTAEAVKRWLEKVRQRAQRLAPKNTGDMAGSLHEYVTGEPPTSAGIKSDSRKIRFVHGKHMTPAPPRRRTRPHFPPANQSLTAWSRAKGLNTALVQHAIAARGTPIIPFISEAIDEELPTLQTELNRAEKDIEREWNK